MVHVSPNHDYGVGETKIPNRAIYSEPQTWLQLSCGPFTTIRPRCVCQKVMQSNDPFAASLAATYLAMRIYKLAQLIMDNTSLQLTKTLKVIILDV